MNFGAFIQIAEGIDGLVHISEIVADRRINHPRDVLREGQRVKALVLAIDSEKRQIKLSMKQLIPTSIDEYIAEHKVGDKISGRVVELNFSGAIVELGEGIRSTCRTAPAACLRARFFSNVRRRFLRATLQCRTRPLAAFIDAQSPLERQRSRAVGQTRALAESQIRTFKITKLDPDSKKIEVDLA